MKFKTEELFAKACNIVYQQLLLVGSPTIDIAHMGTYVANSYLISKVFEQLCAEARRKELDEPNPTRGLP